MTWYSTTVLQAMLEHCVLPVHHVALYQELVVLIASAQRESADPVRVLNTLLGL